MGLTMESINKVGISVGKFWPITPELRVGRKPISFYLSPSDFTIYVTSQTRKTGSDMGLGPEEDWSLGSVGSRAAGVAVFSETATHRLGDLCCHCTWCCKG